MVRRLACLVALVLALPAAAEGPIAPDRRGGVVPDRAFDMEALELDLAIDPTAGAVAGTARWTVRRLGPGPLVLDQVALDIEAVTSGGAPLPWRVDGDTLVIDVPGAGGEVAVRYRATPRTGLHLRRPGPGSPDTYAEVWSQGEGEDNRYWFPGYDHPNDRFTYRGRFAVPDGWKVLTNADGTDLVNYLVMVAAGPYEVIGPPENQAWVPPGTSAEAVAGVTATVPGMMAHFAARTGVAYPWGPYRQVFVQRFLYTGMENTSATVEHVRLLQPAALHATRPGIESVVAHELAHQWYGDWVTCRDWRELWLNEGFATFFAADWMAQARGPSWWAADVKAWLASSRGPGSLAGRPWLGPDTPANHNVYQKGASVLQMLRVMLGEERFWAGIREYTASEAPRLVDSHELQRAFERTSGMALDWFFQQWVELPYVPMLKSGWSWADGALTVDLAQPGEALPVYTLPVTLEVGRADGGVERRTVWMERRDLQVSLPLPAAPRYVAVDPDGGLLVVPDAAQAPAAWTAQLGSPSPYARLVALDALSDAGAVDPLRERLFDGGAPLPERAAAARGLGRARACAPLLDALALPDPAVRLAAADALSDCAVPEIATATAAAWRREANPDIRAQLLEALGWADGPAGLKAARAVLGYARRDDAEVRAATDLLGRAGVPGDLPLLLRDAGSRDRRVGGLRAAAAVVGRQALGPERDAWRAMVARSAELELDDLDLRHREAAVAVLGEVGDATSVARLEAFRRVEEVRGLQGAAEAAIAAIRARVDAVRPPTPAETDARLRALEEKLQALESDARKRPLPE